MKNNAHFQTGSGCYTCLDCGKQTRETGESESFIQLCKDCLTAGQLINSYEDGNMEYDALLVKLDAIGYSY